MEVCGAFPGETETGLIKFRHVLLCDLVQTHYTFTCTIVTYMVQVDHLLEYTMTDHIHDILVHAINEVFTLYTLINILRYTRIDYLLITNYDQTSRGKWRSCLECIPVPGL